MDVKSLMIIFKFSPCVDKNNFLGWDRVVSPKQYDCGVKRIFALYSN